MSLAMKPYSEVAGFSPLVVWIVYIPREGNIVLFCGGFSLRI